MHTFDTTSTQHRVVLSSMQSLHCTLTLNAWYVVLQLWKLFAKQITYDHILQPKAAACCRDNKSFAKPTICCLVTCAFVAYVCALILQATQFERMQWSVLNAAVSLVGYWCAAAVVDKPW
jgi:hypothetical protein